MKGSCTVGPNALVATALLAIAGAGCTQTTVQVDTDSELAMPGEVLLRFGDEVVIDGSVLRLSFVSVLEDSRCPVDATCVWEGNARVRLGIAAGSGPTHPLELNTAFAVPDRHPHSADWNGVRVTLLAVFPEPRAGVAIPENDYRVTVRVEPLG